VTDKSFRNVTEGRCLDKTLRNPISVHEDIKSRFIAEDDCCYLSQNLLSFHLLLM